jgi:hypothetical protein
MNIYKKLTVHNGWVNGFTHHSGFHGGPLPTSAVMGLISHTMVGNLPHTDAMAWPDLVLDRRPADEPFRRCRRH